MKLKNLRCTHDMFYSGEAKCPLILIYIYTLINEIKKQPRICSCHQCLFAEIKFQLCFQCEKQEEGKQSRHINRE